MSIRKKRTTTIRFTSQAKELVEKMADVLGVTKTSVIEMAIREKAKREKISLGDGQIHEDKRNLQDSE